MCYSILRGFPSSHLTTRKGAIALAQAGNDIPREDYTRPVYIQARKTILSAAFAPQKITDSMWRSTLHSRTMSLYSENEEHPFCDFVIRSQPGGKRQPPVRIKIDYQSVEMINKVFYAVEDNCWASVAAAYRYQECKEQLDEKYQTRKCTSTPPEYLRELARIEEQATRSGIEDSIEPLVVCKFVNDGWNDTAPGNETAGATMLVYYQPRTETGDPVKRPWTIEIRQYKLADVDGSTVYKNEVSQSIRLGVDDMNKVLDRLICDYLLWAGYEKTVAFYKANPARYRTAPRKV